MTFESVIYSVPQREFQMPNFQLKIQTKSLKMSFFDPSKN